MAGRFSVEAVFKAVDRVTAPVSRMQNRISKMTRSMTRGLRNVNRALGKVSKIGMAGIRSGAILATAAVAALAVALNSATSKADALAKQSRRLQFPIEELQEWKFVAEQSGVANTLFDASLGAFSKRLGEAKNGIGPLVSGLKKLNPELLAQITSTDSIAEALDIYIKAIRASDSATEQAALANAAFSRSGLTLVDIAKNSAAQIEALKIEQRENGNVTMEQAVNAEAYGDAMNALSRTMTGFINAVLLPMTPLLTELMLEFRQWALANKDIVASDILKFGRDLVENFGEIVSWVKRIGIGIAVFTGLIVTLKLISAILIAMNLIMAAGPFGLLAVAAVAAAALIIANWEPIKQFFSDLWAGITMEFDNAMSRIMGVIDRVKSVIQSATSAVRGVTDSLTGSVSGAFDSTKSFFGFGDDESPGQAQIVSPQDRLARSIESVTTNKSEITIKDETGRAEVTGGKPGQGLKLQPSGAF